MLHAPIIYKYHVHMESGVVGWSIRKINFSIYKELKL